MGEETADISDSVTRRDTVWINEVGPSDMSIWESDTTGLSRFGFHRKCGDFGQEP